MAGRDNRSRGTSGTPTIPPASNPKANSNPNRSGTPERSSARVPVNAQTQQRPTAKTPVKARRGPALPIDIHRLIAALALVLMLLMTLLTPFAPSAANPVAFITPQIDGTGSVSSAFTGRDLETALFPYQTFIERSQGNLASSWPEPATIIHSEPGNIEARRALVGELFSSTSGIQTRVKDSGLESNPPADKLEAIGTVYDLAVGDQDKADFGRNGRAALNLLRSLLVTDTAERQALERGAILRFQTSASNQPKEWRYTYNWAIANLISGNYKSAYEGFRTVLGSPTVGNFTLPVAYMGVAALRLGEPDEAIARFRAILDYKIPTDAKDIERQAYNEARTIAQEALGDAQWARRDPATAYNTYLNALLFGTSNTGLYRKWVRLGLEQHAYERLADDMLKVARAPDVPSDLKGRAHHDRARLLSFLGRQSEAMAEYKTALNIGADDAPLLVSYAQALFTQGSYNDALATAENAIRKVGRDVSAGDMTAVARSVVTTTSLPFDRQVGQQLLDAHLLRAMVWSKQGQTGAVDNLVSNITREAAGEPANVAGLLQLYGGYAYEAAARVASGNAAGDFYTKAAGKFKEAWDLLSGEVPGTMGRAAALAGQARTTALSTGKTAADGIAVLKVAGYDPVAIKKNVSTDADAPDTLYEGANLLETAGQAKEATNAFRVAGIVRNLRDAGQFVGPGRPLWQNNGTASPAVATLRAADAARTEPGGDLSLAVMRYKQAYGLDPALAPAWNNLGVLYTEQGKPATGQYYLNLASIASPNYALGNHNLATAAYQDGFGRFFTAEGAQGDARRAMGPASTGWSYSLQYDERGSMPAPANPPADFLSRLGAIIIIALLLLHTLVGYDRMTNRMGIVPTRGIVGRLAAMLDAQAKTAAPGLVTPSSSSRALAIAVVVPSIIAMLALAWSAGRGSFGVTLLYLPVGLVAALLAFGANELGQRFAAGRAGAGKEAKITTAHHLWPTGVLLGILSIPFGFFYGWQNVTRIKLAGESAESDAAASNKTGARRGRTTEELELAFEQQAEAAADSATGATAGEAVMGGAGATVPGAGRLGLTPAARIMFVGLAADLVLMVLFGVGYWLTGWPSLRLGLFAAALVLAFTAVSEPPADGWTLYRRNAPLWLAVFTLGAVTAVLLAAGLV